MNGVHDLGGMHGFGTVVPEADEPVFRAGWERRVLALVLAVGALGRWNIDQNRHTRESLPPLTYLSSSYYRIWFLGLLRNLAAAGLVPAGWDSRVPQARSWSEIDAGLRSGTPYNRPPEHAAKFAIGDTVRTRNINPPGHTRLPRYARSKVGVVVLHHGGHVFPDRNAVPVGEQGSETSEHLYTVEFPGTELWGPDADPRLRVSVDAFEPYLEAW